MNETPQKTKKTPLQTRHRSWHFYTFIISFSIIFLGYLAWKFTPLKNELEARVIKQLQPYLGESFYITDFSIGLKSLSFYNVRAASPDENYSLDIAEIAISFDPGKLFSHQLQPVKTIESVTIRKPQLTIYYTQKPRAKSDFSIDKITEEILRNLKTNFPEIDHVRIREGGVLLQLPWQTTLTKKQIPLINGLNGRLEYLANSEEITLKLRGELLGAENSFIKLSGKVNFPNKHFDGTINFDESYITSKLPFWGLNFWEIENGRLAGEVRVTNEQFSIDSLFFHGDVKVKNMATSIYNQRAVIDSFNLRFDRQNVLIDTFDCKVETGDVRFGGMLYNIFRPTADWRASVKNFPVKFLKQSHSIFKYAYEGKLKGWATFTGPIKSLDVHAEMRSPDVLYAVVPFNTVRTILDYNTQKKVLYLPYLRADFFKFRTRGFGYVNFNTDSLDFDLKSDIRVPDDYFNLMTGLNGGKVKVNTDLYGNFKSKNFRGKFRYKGQGVDTLLVSGRGPFTLDDQLLNFRVRSDDRGDDFTFRGTIDSLFSGPDIDILEAHDFPMAQLSYNPLVKNFLKDRYTNFYFSGPYYSLSTKMKIVAKDEPLRKIAEASGNIKDIFLDNQRYRGRFTAYTAPQKITGKFDVDFSVKGVNATIFSRDLFAGNLFMSAKPDGPFKGKLQISPASLTDYLENSPDLANIFGEGVIHGNMAFNGTVKNPAIDFAFDAENAIINKVGYYNARISGKLNDHLLSLRDGWIHLNSDTLMNAAFQWNTHNDQIKLRITGNHLESNFIAETIFHDPDIIRGEMKYAIVGDGTLTHPMIYGDASIKSGKLFGKNAFQSMSISLEDSVSAARNFWNIDNHIFKIRDFLYSNRGEYDVSANGIISAQEYRPVDLKINVVGNVLAELPQIQPYFIDPQTDGRLYAHIKGSRVNPFLDEFDLDIFNGTMSFDGIIPKVTDLRIDANLTNAGNFINIKTIEGRVDGRWVRIYNVPAETASTVRELQPWLLEDIGLNFGVFVLETEDNGIPLHFPGMMEEGDVGYFAARGKTADEKFYFAGPPSRPVCRGATVLYNCRVTFPFIGMYDDAGEYAYDDNDKVIAFMMNMEWDLAALPGNNNRYFVNIPGYVGDVFMDLNIDNASKGLDFTGRLIDESFRVNGNVYSTRGRVEYLDVNFRVDRFGAEFNPYEIYPEVYGSAFTTVRTEGYNTLPDDPENVAAIAEPQSVPRDIYLKLYVTDPITGREVSKGRWEDFRFKLTSRDNVIGETQEQLLSYLGYSFNNLQNKAGEVGLTLTQNFLIRPLFRPIERQLERKFNLDYVRVRSNFASHLLYLSFQNGSNIFSNPTFLQVNNNLDPALQLLQSSELTLGKYVFKDVYMSYTGQLIAGFEDTKLGVNHTVGFEYRLLYKLLLEVEVSRFQFDPFYFENDAALRKRNISIRLRRSFNF